MKQLPKFIDKNLFEQAFTHRSYLNESKKNLDSNERLEFLGDSILSFVVSQYLYREYPTYDEGILTNIRSLLVNTKNLAEAAKELGFGDYLKLSKGEHEAQGRKNQSILADSYEAYIGALFLDQGLSVVSLFIEDTLLSHVNHIIDQKTYKDPKSLLQEYAQSQKKGSPLYKVVLEEGPPHAKQFTVAAFIGSLLVGEGKGKSKQEAEENAAKQALEKIEKE